MDEADAACQVGEQLSRTLLALDFQHFVESRLRVGWLGAPMGNMPVQFQPITDALWLRPTNRIFQMTSRRAEHPGFQLGLNGYHSDCVASPSGALQIPL